jgi:hypothetical protein
MGKLSRIFTGKIILATSLLLAVGCGESGLTATLELTDSPDLTSTPILPVSTPVPTPRQATTATRTPYSPTDTPEPTDMPTPTPNQDESNNLMQALSALPTGANHVGFTNWAFIKEYEEFQDITSASNDEEWVEFWLACAERHAAPSFFGARWFYGGSADLRGHAKLWGWDSTDLDWEAGVSRTFGPGYVLKFRDGFDFTPVIARFEERGFTASVYQGVTIYTHELDVEKDWLLGTEFSILNTAVLADESMLFMSIGLSNVQSMLDAYHNRSASLADDPVVRATASRLGEVGAAVVIADPCSAFSALSSKVLCEGFFRLPESKEKCHAQLKDRPQLQGYEVLGIGYRYDGTQPVGLIVMHFSDASRAASDLEPRRQLAVDGFYLAPDAETDNEVYFTLNKANVEGNMIVMEVTPGDRRPSLFFYMELRDDMMFASCP